MMFSESNSNFQLKEGTCMQARHWCYDRNDNNSAWFNVRIGKREGSIVEVILDEQCNDNPKLDKKYDNNWWIFDDDNKMLREK